MLEYKLDKKEIINENVVDQWSLFNSGQALIKCLEILLDVFDIFGKLRLSLHQQLWAVAKTNLQLLLYCVQLGKSFAELKSWNGQHSFKIK